MGPRVPESARAAYESTARADGLADFCFREVDAGGQAVPAAHRPEYLPVYYVEPRQENESAVGYDLNSDTSRRLALQQARDSGQPIATAPLHLVQESARQTGLLVLLAVYRGLPPRPLRSVAINWPALLLLFSGWMIWWRAASTNWNVKASTRA